VRGVAEIQLKSYAIFEKQKLLSCFQPFAEGRRRRASAKLQDKLTNATECEGFCGCWSPCLLDRRVTHVRMIPRSGLLIRPPRRRPRGEVPTSIIGNRFRQLPQTESDSPELHWRC